MTRNRLRARDAHAGYASVPVGFNVGNGRVELADVRLPQS